MICNHRRLNAVHDWACKFTINEQLERSKESLVKKIRTAPDPCDRKKAARRWVEYRKLLSLDLWTWAKSNKTKTTSTLYLFAGERLQRFVVIFWVFRGENLVEQREDVSGSHPAQPAEAGGKTHHPQRQRHRDVDPCLQYKEGLQTHAHMIN